ncbi:hypothetical protein Cpir12675_006355 [Ceratocystis pirilliformis]|uniref:HNH nuclease domain-containing protein n=1 Tax=Ceratocystis pirilliformis TaxID=259994 RepID=A0ABR3YI10_9PEZI
MAKLKKRPPMCVSDSWPDAFHRSRPSNVNFLSIHTVPEHERFQSACDGLVPGRQFGPLFKILGPRTRPDQSDSGILAATNPSMYRVHNDLLNRRRAQRLGHMAMDFFLPRRIWSDSETPATNNFYVDPVNDVFFFQICAFESERGADELLPKNQEKSQGQSQPTTKADDSQPTITHQSSIAATTTSSNGAKRGQHLPCQLTLLSPSSKPNTRLDDFFLCAIFPQFADVHKVAFRYSAALCDPWASRDVMPRHTSLFWLPGHFPLLETVYLVDFNIRPLCSRYKDGRFMTRKKGHPVAVADGLEFYEVKPEEAEEWLVPDDGVFRATGLYNLLHLYKDQLLTWARNHPLPGAWPFDLPRP